TIKNILLVVLAFMGLQHSAWSQKIEWDFQTEPPSDKLPCVKKGDHLLINITNINRTLFDITIDKEFKKFDATLPEILNFEQAKQVLQTETASSMVDNTIAANGITRGGTDSLEQEEQARKSLIMLLISSQKIIDCGLCLEEALKNSSTHDIAQKRKEMCLQNKPITTVRSELDASYQAILRGEAFVRSNTKDLATVKHLNEAIKAVDLQKAIEDIITLYYTISDPKTFEFSTTLPIEEAYRLDLKLNITPKEGVNKDGAVLPLHLPIKGVKISVSPGLFFNYFPSAKTTYLEDYQSNGVATDSVLIRTAFDNKSLIPSAGALIHVSFFGCKSIDLAVSAGASTRIESGEMRWHLGGSVILGKARRLVLSVGATLGTSVQELNPNYTLERPYLRADLQDKTIHQEVPQIGAFLGITYNLPIKTKS
ncbi:MAG: hypothetical protein AB8E82_18580, partial [Aureispira sp.]